MSEGRRWWPKDAFIVELNELIEKLDGTIALLVVEPTDGMTSDVPDIAALQAVCHRYDATLCCPRGDLMSRLLERMAGAVIEQVDWRDFLKRWDRPGMLFYVDPPYYGNADDYGVGMFAR